MYYNIKALILNTKLVSEADKIITAYTDKWGKIYAIVPSAKKIVAKLNAATEPITESELIVYQNSQYSRPTITGARILNNNTAVKQDFHRNLLAFYVCEISDKFAPMHLPNAKKYELSTPCVQYGNKMGRYEKCFDCDHPDRICNAMVIYMKKMEEVDTEVVLIGESLGY